MGAAGVNAPPDFELAEHVFDFVAAFIERLVERNLQFSVGLWRDAWGDAAFQQSVAEPVGGVFFVTEPGFGVMNGFKHDGCALEITHLAFGKQQNQLTACSIASPTTAISSRQETTPGASSNAKNPAPQPVKIERCLLVSFGRCLTRLRQSSPERALRLWLKVPPISC